MRAEPVRAAARSTVTQRRLLEPALQRAEPELAVVTDPGVIAGYVTTDRCRTITV